MQSPIQRGLDHLARTIRRTLGVPVVYRDGNRAVDLVATEGRTAYEATSARGVIERYESHDFIFPAADLVLAGRIVTPRRGATFEKRTEAGLQIFEMLPLAGGETHFHHPDAGRTLLRVHTKLVETKA